MPRRDKHGRTAESYRAEAEILGAKLPKGADLAVGAEKCGGCH